MYPGLVLNRLGKTCRHGNDHCEGTGICGHRVPEKRGAGHTPQAMREHPGRPRGRGGTRVCSVVSREGTGEQLNRLRTEWMG